VWRSPVFGRAAALFERHFTRKRIADHFVRLDGETRVGIKITDPVLKETTDINFPGAEPLPSDLTALRATIDQIDAEWFVIAGSLPPGLETTIYRDLTNSLKARGRKVALDTSGETLTHAIEALPQRVHEVDDLRRRLLDRRDAVVAAAKSWSRAGLIWSSFRWARRRMFVGAEGSFSRPRQKLKSARLARVMRWSRSGLGGLRGLSLAETGVCRPHSRSAPLASRC
jgi:hypothetical protein